jgi:hypothetical protein
MATKKDEFGAPAEETTLPDAPPPMEEEMPAGEGEMPPSEEAALPPEPPTDSIMLTPEQAGALEGAAVGDEFMLTVAAVNEDGTFEVTIAK